MKYNVQLQVYEGPLDLLYDMISKQKIDIKDISIIDITKQYINYITALEKMDLEIASEFITMASKLLEIKSRYLLYKQKNDDEVQDPRLELMEKLEEYKKFKLASEDLKDNITYIDDLYYRKKEEIVIDDTMDLDNISIDAIKNILPYILKVKSNESKSNKDEKLEKMKYLKGSKRIERVKPMVKNTFSQKEILHFQIIWTGLLEQCLQANQL